MRSIVFLICLALMLSMRTLWLMSYTVPLPIPDETTSASVMFIENVGQFRAGARFQSQNEIGAMFVADDALWFTVLEPLSAEVMEAIETHETEPPLRGGVNLRVSFVGANPHPTIEPFMPLTTSVNYLEGNDPDKWHRHVPVWGGVRYRELYPGIDLELSSEGNQTVQRFVVTDPHRADLATVAIQVAGAEEILLSNGQVHLQTFFGEVALPLFEVIGGMQAEEFAPQVRDSVVHTPFQIEPLRLSAVPDSTLLPSNLHYSTLLGGAGYDYTFAVAVDSTGSMYLGGLTESFDFPTTPGAFDPDVGTPLYVRNAYLTKLNPAGTMLEYSTYLQGNSTDEVHGIALDTSGAAYLTGETRSATFPTTPNNPTPGFGGGVDAFALKLSPDGSELEYGMFLGGNAVDLGRDITIAPDGTVVVVGRTNSRNFPTTPNAYDTELGGTEDEFDIFVTKIAPDGVSLNYSTYIGGTRDDDGWGVAMDSTGAAYVVGRTGSQASYPTTPGVFNPVPDFAAVVVTKVAPDGTHLLYSTGVGTDTDFDVGKLALTKDNEVVVLATVWGGDFPVTADAYDTECGTGGAGCDTVYNDTVLFKLNATASEMRFGTYLGGNGWDQGTAVVLDGNDNIYAMGWMMSYDVLPTAGAYRSATVGCGLWKFNPTGSELLHFATPPDKGCDAMVLQATDVVIFSGAVSTNTTAYETTPGAYDTTPNGESDAVAGRLLITLEATTATIPTTGGTLLSPVDETTYTFTPNSFIETVTLTHAPRHPLSLPPIAPLVIVGSPFVNYARGSDGQSALQPIRPYTLEIQYDENRLSINEAGLRLYYWDGTAWVVEPTTMLDTRTNSITATPNRLGWWVVLGKPNQIYLPAIRR